MIGKIGKKTELMADINGIGNIWKIRKLSSQQEQMRIRKTSTQEEEQEQRKVAQDLAHTHLVKRGLTCLSHHK